jgi:glycosyltransferase involved in cell wall biosynthesis
VVSQQGKTMVASTEAIVHTSPHASERTRVLFVLGSLAGGGAERIVAHLVTHLNRDQFDARVGLLWRHGDYLSQFDESQLVVARLGQGWIPYRDQPPWWQLLPSLVLVPLQQREIVRRFHPHIVVTVTKSMNIAARVSLAFVGRGRLKWVVREGNNTGAMIDSESSTGFLRRLHNLAVRTAYRSADRVIAISDGVGVGLTRRFGVDPTRVRTIFNAVDLATVTRRAEEPLAGVPHQPFVVAAGRLVHQKGFDVLVRAFADHVGARPVSLVILGEGPARSSLEQLALECGIGDRVLLLGFVANPWAYFARASAFVCSSRWEGFGNVIIEAMACGTPVVATDCDFGPREIVRHGESGLLVPIDDARALGNAIASVLDDRDLGWRLAAGARRRSIDFDVPQMTHAYERLFNELRRPESANSAAVGAVPRPKPTVQSLGH